MDSSGADIIKAEVIEIIEEHDASNLPVLDESSTADDSETPAAGSMLTAYMFERNEREVIVRFIDMVRMCPEIWDLSSAAYREKFLRKRSFRNIGEQLGWSYEEVFKKYNNLRTYYSKELVKSKRDPGFISRWPYFDQLDSFMRRTIHIKKMKNRQQNKLIRQSQMRLLSARNQERRSGQLSFADETRHRSATEKRLNAATSEYDIQTSSASHQGTSLSSSRGPIVNISHVAAPSLQVEGQEREHQQQVRERQVSQVAPATISRPQAENPPTSLISSPSISSMDQSYQNTSAATSMSPPMSLEVQSVQQHQQHVRNLSCGYQVLGSHSSSYRQSHHQRQTRVQPQGVGLSLPQLRTRGNQSKEQQSLEIQQSASSSAASPPTISMSSSETSNLMETSDTIFGKLIASQLAKITEGRKKEQLKINLMQQIMQAMFENGND